MTSNLKRGDKVVKVLEGGGVRTASFQRIASNEHGVIKLVDAESLDFRDDMLMNEINPAVPGFRSYLVAFDGGEEARVSYDDDDEYLPARYSGKRKAKAG
jgi:hypothetical protein